MLNGTFPPGQCCVRWIRKNIPPILSRHWSAVTESWGRRDKIQSGIALRCIPIWVHPDVNRGIWLWLLHYLSLRLAVSDGRRTWDMGNRRGWITRVNFGQVVKLVQVWRRLEPLRLFQDCVRLLGYNFSSQILGLLRTMGCLLSGNSQRIYYKSEMKDSRIILLLGAKEPPAFAGLRCSSCGNQGTLRVVLLRIRRWC